MEKSKFKQSAITISKGVIAFICLLMSSLSLAIRPTKYGIVGFDYSEKDIEIVIFLMGVFFLVWAFFPLDRSGDNQHQ